MNVLILDCPATPRLRKALHAAGAHIIDLAAAAPSLIRFDSQNVAAPGEDAEGAWNKIFPVDVTRFRADFPGGKIALTKAYLSGLVKNWERMGKPALPVDYWHDDASPDSIASGWIQSLELRGDGLYARIKWTATAKARIAADELRFLSPSFALDMMDPMTGKPQGPTLLGAALLNKPFLFDLPRVAASREPSTPPPHQENAMLRTLLLSLFALPEVTTDELLAERVRTLKAENLKFAADLAEKIELTSKPLKVELAASREEVTKLLADVTKLQAEKQDAEISTFLGKLESEKKLLPANRDSAKAICLKMGMEFATKHFASASPIVPTGVIGFGSKEGEELTAEQVTAQLDTEMERIKKEEPSLTFSEIRKRLGATKPELLKLAAKVSAVKPVTA